MVGIQVKMFWKVIVKEANMLVISDNKRGMALTSNQTR